MGLTGTGVFNHSGGSHTTSDLELGSGAGSAGTYNLSGTGTLTASKVNVGVSGTAIFTQSASTFSTNGTSLKMAANAGSSGTYELDGGTLTTAGVLGGSGASVFNFNGGHLSAAANSSDFFGGVGRINLRNNSSIFDTQAFTVTVPESLLHSNIPGDAAVDGGLDKYGSGTLILAGTNSLTGFINVDFGTLELAGSNVMDRVNVGSISAKLVIDSAASLSVDDLDIRVTSATTAGFQNNGGQVVMHTGQIGDAGKAIATQTAGSMSVTATGAINGLVVGVLNGTGTLNLDGGTISVNRITTQKTGILNLNGGTLLPQENKTNFLTLTTVNVRAGGAKFDTNGFDITVGQNLLHSTIGGDAALDGGLTKSGAGQLTLSGTNSFTGGTAVVGGELVAGVNNSLGSGDVSVLGTAVRLTIATGVADAIADNARLSLAGGGAPGVADAGFLLLNGGVETVGSLMLGSTLFTSGTFTSAAFPEYITGAGSVVVVPEPSVAALGGATLLLALVVRPPRRTASSPPMKDV